MDVFSACRDITRFVDDGNQNKARNNLLILLNYLNVQNEPYTPLVNHLIRKTGLYPYMEPESSNWTDQLVYEVFKSDVGLWEPVTLHKEQSSILKKLLNDKSLAVSAPTSFGKSFIIDAYISIKKPDNVVIIVPTIALTDETRRRINKKFSSYYKIITQSNISLAEKNIFIFPQERAFNYFERIKEIDILIIDEFYKASFDFDKERAPSLLRVIEKFSRVAKQKYFLAPNISFLKDNIFSEKIDFIKIDFNTVYTEVTDLYSSVSNEEEKQQSLLAELKLKETKSLVYAGTYAEIEKLTRLFIEEYEVNSSVILNQFSEWLTINYGAGYKLSDLVKRGVGIHNGRLHRSIGQIQVKLFEEDDGLSVFITTSSIIEGVNTSAENIFLWSNKKGQPKIDAFTYKNIIGRGGRMFKYFVGKVFLLAPPPRDENTQLTLDFDVETMSHMEEFQGKSEITLEQKEQIEHYEHEMHSILGKATYEQLQKDNLLQSNDSTHIRRIAGKIYYNQEKWHSLVFLNSENTAKWDTALYLCLDILGRGVGIEYNKFVSFIKVLSDNWESDIPAIMRRLKSLDVDEEKYFELERVATFKFPSALNDINILYNLICKDNIDISSFILKVSNAFLPKLVFQLEEYGLPRMISKKINSSKVLDLLEKDKSINELLVEFNTLGKDYIKSSTRGLHPFDLYIIDYFYEGIETYNQEATK